MRPSFPALMHHAPPQGITLWGIVFVNGVLAVFGLIGLIYLGGNALIWVALSVISLDLKDIVVSLAALLFLCGPILLGLWLAFGYWRTASQSGPWWRPRVFWSVSVGFNALCFLAWAAFGVSGVIEGGSVSPILAIPLAWTLFVLHFSIQKRQEAQPTASTLPL